MSDAAARPRRTPDEQRKLRNARQRRWYARQHPHRRQRIVPVPATDPMVEMLVDLGWLQESDADDRQMIAQALAAMLHDTARGHFQRFS